MEENINIIDKIRNPTSTKSMKLTAKKVADKYKKMRQKRPQKTFLVDEEDIETIDYTNEPQEDLFSSESILAKADEEFNFEMYKKEQAEALDKMKREKPFANESILAAANVFDFEKFKKQQEDTIREFKEQQLSAKSENKNVEITAKKITEKYTKMRKKQIISKSQKEETFESFLLPLKKK